MHRDAILPKPRLVAVSLALLLGFATAGQALDRLEFTVLGASESLEQALRDASILIRSKRENNSGAQDLFADARAEYGRLLAALYAQGRYSAVIHVRIDGREAADIPPLDAPTSISVIEVSVDPGPAFTFSRAEVSPLAKRTVLPEDFARGMTAKSDSIAGAVLAGVDGWRAQGHAKAAVASQDLVADHATATLSANVTLNPGPQLRFGTLVIDGEVRMREDRVRRIAGYPEGGIYDPKELDRVASRLRRTGIFQSVTLTEDDRITDPDLLGMTIDVLEAKTRRYSFGAEVASFEGVALTGTWLHRNLLGGGERLTIDGGVTNIGGQTGGQTGGVDYALGVTLERPATPGPDTTASVSLDLAHLDEPDYLANNGTVELSFSHVFSDQLSAHVGVGYEYSNGRDAVGDFLYRSLTLPMGVTWDRRDRAADATRGFYLDVGAKPFLGFGFTDNGARLTLDARAYKALDEGNRVVFAARLQGGAIVGASLLGTPRDDLFYSGGGGTVRGQPYQSLGVTTPQAGPDPLQTGGTEFLAGSLEARLKISDRIGVVGFFDMGLVGAGGTSATHSGAGVGLRYETGFGPIRFDVATPVGGTTGDGVQLYVGLGQSF